MIARRRHHLAPLLATLLTLLAACKSSPPTTATQAPTQREATSDAATQDAALDALLDELWALNMKTFPGWATYEGIRDHDAELSDISPEATERYTSQLEAIASRAEALPPEQLSPMARDTRRMLIMSARQQRAERVCEHEKWSVDGLGGPQVSFPMLPVFHLVRSQHDVDTLNSRYQKIAPYIEQHIANLRAGLAKGLVAPKINVERALTQLDKLIALPVDDAHPMLAIKLESDAVQVDDSALSQSITQVVVPSLTTYRDMLRQEILPAAREQVGLSNLPNGSACYMASIAGYIGEGFSPDALHQRGLDELARMEAGMVKVGEELGMTSSPTPSAVMRTISEDPANYATSEQQIVSLNEEVVQAAAAKVPDFFGVVPDARVEVRPLEPHRAPDAPAAYYNSPPEDGSRPGIYYVNTYQPQTRPLYNLRALAVHEAIPGHHLQIAIAKELPEVHTWRRNSGQTAFVEGWALYAELLADEMDLYPTPLDRFGMYNYQAWRAVRLVLDTGLHSKGWTRQQAIDFMTAHTALPENEIANEVDRYIAWPGQALSYMVGRMEIQRLRQRAEAELGERFDLAEFHDVVLGSGAVPLTILAEHVEAWLETK